MTGSLTRTGRNGQPRPPKDLSRDAKRLWQQLFDGSDVDEVARPLLDSFCQSWQTRQEARALLAKEGIVLVEETAAGLKRRRPHPAILIEHNAAATMMRAWRLLGYDQQPPEGV
jgi:phage terminase small subunit